MIKAPRMDIPKLPRMKGFDCPACGRSILVKLGHDETQIRCIRCKGTPIHLSLIDAIKVRIGSLVETAACELSSRGALVRFLRRSAAFLAVSEYFDRIPPGTTLNGVRCEDVQALSYPDAHFDLCTSTEVFEHVPDDLAGFREMRRVLKPGGALVFTVPLGDAPQTVTRARLGANGIEHVLPPAYHGDRLRGANRVLVFRDYGHDICQRLMGCGFSRVELHLPALDYFGHRRKVVVAFA